MSNKWLQRVMLPAAGLALLGASVWFLFRELRNIDFRKVLTDISHFSIFHIIITLALVAAGYMVTLGYDFLALRFVHENLSSNQNDTCSAKASSNISKKKVALASFISCAFSNTVSLPVINVSGTRFRFYSKWGVSAKHIAYMVSFIGLSTWIGLLLITGIVCVLSPPDLSSTSNIPDMAIRSLGGLFIAVVILILIVCAARSELRIGKYHLYLPSLKLSLGQLAVGCGDWIFQALVFYMVLNIFDLSPFIFMPAYFCAMLLAMLAHLPAGLGVFDAGIIGLLSPLVGADKLVAGLVLYRVFFHVLPLALATFLFGVYELYARLAHEQKPAIKNV